MNTYTFDNPTEGNNVFSVRVTDDRGARARSNVVEVWVDQPPLARQWVDANGDGVYDQVLAIIERPDSIDYDLTRSSAYGITLWVEWDFEGDEGLYWGSGEFGLGLGGFSSFGGFGSNSSQWSDSAWGSDRYWGTEDDEGLPGKRVWPLLNLDHPIDYSDFGQLGTGEARGIFSVSLEISGSLAHEGFYYQIQRAFSRDHWVNVGPAFPGSSDGFRTSGVAVTPFGLEFLHRFYRAVRLGKPSQMVGQLIKADVNGDGVDDDVQEISTEVLNPDNGNGEMIVVAKCPEGEGAIGCSDAVIKKDEKWSQVEEEENKKSIREILPWSPDYPFLCRGTAADCHRVTPSDRVGFLSNYRVFAIEIPISPQQPKGIGFADLTPLIRVYRPKLVQKQVPWDVPRASKVIPRFQYKLGGGVGIRVNRDDDNNNTIKDADDPGHVDEENDLIEVEYLSPQIPEGFDLVIRTPPALRVWNHYKRSELLVEAGAEAIIPKISTPSWYHLESSRIFWIECIKPFDRGELEFILRPQDGRKDVPIYKIPFRSFKVFFVGFSGDTTLFRGFDLPEQARENGMFTVSKMLYFSGFNVAYYNENVVKHNGDGQAFLEASRQIQTCDISEMVFFGHSHGGGALYNLALRLSSILGSCKCGFSAYIDAIKAGEMEPEDRHPPGFLLNFYQLNILKSAGFLHGTHVRWAENHNLTEKGFTHTEMDNSGFVIGTLGARIIRKYLFRK